MRAVGEPERVVVVIPARGGSKGVVGKNLRRVGGQTLVARAARAALGARLVDLVVVSTDDSTIADEAVRAGAEVVSRPPELAGDEAGSESAVLHALDVLEAAPGARSPDVVVLVQCTSPFLSSEDIDGTVGTLWTEEADVAFTAVQSHHFLWELAAGGLTGVNHDMRTRERRQDRPVEYLETGGAYAMRTAGFRRSRHRFFGMVVPHVVPASSQLEIDDEDDLEMARAVRVLMGGHDGLDADQLDAVVLDFDGVLTDNRVLVSQDGTEAVWCSRADGWAIRLLQDRGLAVVVLSTEENPVTSVRCRKLGIEVVQGLGRDKLDALKAWAADRSIPLERVLFVGNDTNDLDCLNAVGWPVAVGDAEPEARAVARVILERPGGQGAIRELAGLLGSARPAHG